MKHSITKIISHIDYSLLLEFDNNEKRNVNIIKVIYLDSRFQAYRNYPNKLSKVYIQSGNLYFDNHLSISGPTLYDMGEVEEELEDLLH